MTDSRFRGPVGKAAKHPKAEGISARREASGRGPVRQGKNSATPENILRRIRKWRDAADVTPFFPDAVKALDHYLAGTGKFVVIPPGKAKSVRAQSEASHLRKSKEIFSRVAIMEAAAAWLAASGLPARGGQLVPTQIEFTLTYQSGEASRGVSNDNLTYFNSCIMSEVRFQAKQLTIPTDLAEEQFDIRISVAEWKSWVVDNYDWEGDKKFGLFAALGLPTQKEMNSLHMAGLAKSYQRSSRSWVVSDHGMAPWTETPYSMNTLREGGMSRLQAKREREEKLSKERRMGALPSPRPAEEMLR
jgi:hypothetical protein